jgi:hypothetical protein
METPTEVTYYVARVNNEDVLHILNDQRQFAIDDWDDLRLNRPLVPGNLGKLKHARPAYKLLLDIPRRSRVLLIGTKWWGPSSPVTAKSVLAYGTTTDDLEPYCFRNVAFWRHRLRLKSLHWVGKKGEGITLEKLGIRDKFPPSRFFHDRQGLAERILKKLGKHGITWTNAGDRPSHTGQPTTGHVLFTPSRKSRGKRSSRGRRSEDSKCIGDSAERVVWEDLKRRLSVPEKKSLRWVAHEKEYPGWDIEYKKARGQRVFIEVKGTSAARMYSFDITANEWEAAKNQRGKFWLCLVGKCTTNKPLTQWLRNPHAMFQKREMGLTPASYKVELLKS